MRRVVQVGSPPFLRNLPLKIGTGRRQVLFWPNAQPIHIFWTVSEGVHHMPASDAKNTIFCFRLFPSFAESLEKLLELIPPLLQKMLVVQQAPRPRSPGMSRRQTRIQMQNSKFSHPERTASKWAPCRLTVHRPQATCELSGITFLHDAPPTTSTAPRNCAAFKC